MTKDYDEKCWVQVIGGEAVDLFGHTPAQIKVQHIAWGLSRIPRFCGHTKGEFALSVAQHSLIVEELVAVHKDHDLELLALLHDAHEAYGSGDIGTPFKHAMNTLRPGSGDSVSVLHTSLDFTIRQTFGLPGHLDPKVKDAIQYADLLALRLERDAFMDEPPREWLPLPDPPETKSKWLTYLLDRPVPPAEAYSMFLDRFWKRIHQRHAISANQ